MSSLLGGSLARINCCMRLNVPSGLLTLELVWLSMIHMDPSPRGDMNLFLKISVLLSRCGDHNSVGLPSSPRASAVSSVCVCLPASRGDGHSTP